MNSLKKRITERNLHGAFIAPILSKEEKDELRQMFDRPFVFACSPICDSYTKRTVELEIYSPLIDAWVGLLQEKSDFRMYKGTATMSYDHFSSYIVNGFASFGIIIIMRKNICGPIVRKEKLDSFETQSMNVHSLPTEIDALKLTARIENSHHNSSKKDEMIVVKDTGFSYNDYAIYYNSSVLFKSNTAKYVVFRLLLDNYYHSKPPISKQQLVVALKQNGHTINIRTVRTLISKIRDDIGRTSGTTVRRCIKCNREDSSNLDTGFYLEF